MATTFPTTLQDLDATRGTASQRLNNPSHVTHHTLEDDTLEALQAKVGVDNSAVSTSLDYIIKNTSAGHDHDGTDSKKILASNLDITGLTASQLLRLNAGGTAIESAGITVADVVTATSTTTLSNKTLTAPKFVDLGFIADANGNELVILDTVTSAVNEITLANAATGNSPIFTASGGDTDVGFDFTPKGAGKFRITANDLNLGAAAANIQVNGADPKRGIYVPANAIFGATTLGAASGQYESATNKINTKVLDFDGATEEYAWFALPSPDYWDLSTITAKFHWTAASGSGDVIWGIAGLARSDDDALDTALGSAVLVTDTLLTALDQHTSAATAAVTIGGTPAKGDYVYIRIYRDADAAGDTLNSVDARLLGVTIKFGIAQYDDQ